MIQLKNLNTEIIELSHRELSTIQGGGLGFAGGSLASYGSELYTAYREDTLNNFDNGGAVGRAAIWGLGGALAGSAGGWVGASLAD